jgi:membrane associated rhomboid family serine protease
MKSKFTSSQQMPTYRPYMRDYPGQSRPSGISVMTWLLSAIVAGFVLQNIFLRWFNAGQVFDSAFALSHESVASGKIWALLTYGFLHDPRNLLHILANLLAIYFLGRELIGVMGDRRFAIIYLAAVICGGILWAASNWSTGGSVVGASAGACGLLIIYACFFPNRPVTFLLFFILPVTLKPKHVAWAVLSLDLCGFAFYEVLGASSPFGIAHSTHLGGMLAGWVYFRYVHEAVWRLPWHTARPSLAPARPAKSAMQTAPGASSSSADNRSDLRTEVDRILDKINSEGFGALTTDEKLLLDNAKDLLSRR